MIMKYCHPPRSCTSLMPSPCAPQNSGQSEVLPKSGGGGGGGVWKAPIILTTSCRAVCITL